MNKIRRIKLNRKLTKKDQSIIRLFAEREIEAYREFLFPSFTKLS